MSENAVSPTKVVTLIVPEDTGGVELKPPPGWGKDSLSEFMEHAHRNRFATFARKKEWYDRLANLDGCFMRVATDWVNPMQGLIACTLFLRSHAAYRGACEHALAGQAAETFPQLRACVEYAGYALHIHKHPGLDEKWLRRHDDDATLKAVREEFKVRNVRETIEAANRDTARVFDELYNRSLDFGGHPNERAVTTNLLLVDEEDGGKRFSAIYLHEDGLQLRHALKTTAQVGVCALDILCEVFPERFELLGVRADLIRLRRGL
jgi:hypothetical protein